MKRVCFYLIVVLCLLGCGQRNAKSSHTSRLDSSPSPSNGSQVQQHTIAPVKEDLVYPAIGMIATDFKYVYFGRIGYFDRSFKEDTLVFPPIPGLVHRIAYAMCPTDTCFSEYVALALRCPPIKPLLNWLSDTVRTYIDWFPIGHRLDLATGKQLDIPKKHLKSDKAICDYYIDQLQHVYDGWQCTGGDDHDHDVLNYQAGLLISDCWNSRNLYTFYLAEWNDLMGNGYNNRESFLTIDALTGASLSISDFILPDKFDSLATLMMPRLINDKKEYYIRQADIKPEHYREILDKANGCALIAEGLIIYYYAYNIGFGCDGQYCAVIPYEELHGILKENLAAVLIPASPNEKAKRYNQ